MKIYVSHSTNFDYKTQLYEPLKAELSGDYELILPHESGDGVVDSKDAIKHSDLIIAEVSYPSTGQGIELGWADEYNIPIVCIHRSDANPSSALRIVSSSFIEYRSQSDLLERLGEHLSLEDKS